MSYCYAAGKSSVQHPPRTWTLAASANDLNGNRMRDSETADFIYATDWLCDNAIRFFPLACTLWRRHAADVSNNLSANGVNCVIVCKNWVHPCTNVRHIAFQFKPIVFSNRQTNNTKKTFRVDETFVWGGSSLFDRRTLSFFSTIWTTHRKTDLLTHS